MKKELYCINCDDYRKCIYEERIVKEIIDNKTINYLKKEYICDICKEEVYDSSLMDYNIMSVNNELRKISGLITVNEIAEILDKYNISKKNLAKILGFGEIQIIRYMKSGNPNKEHSDILKLIKDNPFAFELALKNNKEEIEEKSYKNSLGRVKQIELINDNSKLYNIVLYLIKKYDDITNLSIQKVLYFLEGFSNKFLGYNIINDNSEAWKYGPVYEEIYEALAYFKKDNLNIDDILAETNFELDDKEKEYIDNVSNYFACFSAYKLKDMSHLTDPWREARVGLDDLEYSSNIIDKKVMSKYFDNVIKEYNIQSYEDIKKYSTDLFNKTL